MLKRVLLTLVVVAGLLLPWRPTPAHAAALPLSGPDWAVYGDQAALFGYSAGSAGDVNGDGYDDVIVGAPAPVIVGAPGLEEAVPSVSQALVYYGSAAGLESAPAWVVQQVGDHVGFGYIAAAAGDVNGDGYGDVLVTALGTPGSQDEGLPAGAVYVYYGSAAGLPSEPSWTVCGDPAYALFGDMAGGIGDVDGDGYDDLAVSCPYMPAGGAWCLLVFRGSADGLPASPTWVIREGEGAPAIGYVLGTAGDVNGDGYDDILATDPLWGGSPDEFNRGRAYVYHGSAAGPSPEPDWIVEGRAAGALLGYSASTCGDVNGDGYDDVAVGEPMPGYSGPDLPGAGRVHLFYGSANGLGPGTPLVAEGGEWSTVGYTVAGPGDVDRDGYDDLIAGSWFEIMAEFRLKAWFWRGSASGVEEPGTSFWQSEQPSTGGLVRVSGAGDVNGDGCADVLVATPAYTTDGVTPVGRVLGYYGIPARPSADLSLLMSAAPDPVDAGDTVTLSLHVANAGPEEASEVAVSLSLPDEASLLSATGEGWTCDGPTCRRDALAPGEASPITVVLTAPAEGGWLTVTARVSAGTDDPDLTNNDASASVTVTALADLTLALGVGPDPVDAAAPLTCVVAVSNAGPSTAKQVEASITPPDGAEVVSAAGEGWTCDGVTCRRESLVPGEAPAITVVLTAPPEGGAASTGAQVGATTKDPDLTNSQASVDVTVVPLADLSLSVSAHPDPVDAAAPLTCVARVSNEGPSTADQVEVSIAPPAGADVVSAAGEGWTCDGLSCRRDVLAPGEAPSIAVVLTAPAQGGTATTSAQVSAATHDPDPTNNEASAAVTVTPVADLALALSVAPDPVDAAASLNCIVTVSNGGPSTAEQVEVSITPPADAEAVSAAGEGWTCDGLTCRREAVAPGEAPPITVALTAPAEGGAATTSAQVGAATKDPDLANNQASASVTVVPLADLSVSLTANPEPVYAGAPLTYTLSVDNAGPSTAADVVVSVSLPASSSFVAAIGDGWEFQHAEGALTCRRAALPVGVSTIVITVRAPQTPDLDLSNDGTTPGYALISASASVTAADEDPNPGDNADEWVTTVLPGFHLGEL